MSANNGQFKTGLIPWNKGKKGVTGFSETRFKTGSVPANRRPVGSERKCKKDGYVYVKVSEGIRQYKPKHRVIWEQYNGQIPPSHVIVFLDNNVENFDLENLALISRKELIKLNKHEKWTSAPPEIKKALIAVVRLEQSAKGRINGIQN